MDAFYVLLGLFALWLLLRSKGARPTRLPKPVYHWSDDENFDFEIVGESHYQSALRKIAKGRADALTALLVPDDDNPHDAKAIAVYINGLKVGHLSRDDARRFRRRLRANRLDGVTSCSAKLFGGDKDRMLGVWLDMEPFD